MSKRSEFVGGLYTEHLEEISDLSVLRCFLSRQENQSWSDLGEIEERIEAHLDALIVGGEEALKISKELSTNGFGDERIGCAALFCRRSRFHLLRAMFESLEHDDEERLQVVESVLCREWPALWGSKELHALLSLPNGAAMAATLIGYLRDECSHAVLTEIIALADPRCQANALWAMGRLRDRKHIEILKQFAAEPDDDLSQTARLALLRCRYYNDIDTWIHEARLGRDGSLPLVGISGTGRHVDVLMKSALGGLSSSRLMLALGLLGDPVAFDVLLSAILDEQIRESAVTALHLITGAGLYVEKFIPEDTDADELMDEEIEKLKQSESLHPEAEQPGTTVRVLTTDADVWKSYIQEHRKAFRSRLRYRQGRLLAPQTLIAQITQEDNPAWLRKLGHEELVVRFDVDYAFETDFTVVRQQKTIDAYQRWEKINQAGFHPGKWYRAGKPV